MKAGETIEMAGSMWGRKVWRWSPLRNRIHIQEESVHGGHGLASPAAKRPTLCTLCEDRRVGFREAAPIGLSRRALKTKAHDLYHAAGDITSVRDHVCAGARWIRERH